MRTPEQIAPESILQEFWYWDGDEWKSINVRYVKAAPICPSGQQPTTESVNVP